MKISYLTSWSGISTSEVVGQLQNDSRLLIKMSSRFSLKRSFEWLRILSMRIFWSCFYRILFYFPKFIAPKIFLHNKLTLGKWYRFSNFQMPSQNTFWIHVNIFNLLDFLLQKRVCKKCWIWLLVRNLDWVWILIVFEG